MLPRSPHDVQAALLKLGLDIRIQTFEASTSTAQHAANAVGTELGAIVKTMCFTVDSRPMLVLTPGDRQVDDRKLAAIYGVGRKKVRMADASTTLRVTGFAPGGVSPVGHGQEMPILIDSSFQRFELVYAAAGSSNTIFPIPLATLIQITGGQVVDVTRP